LFFSVTASSGGNHYGPFNVEVMRVIDGDTFEARAFVWPGVEMVIKVRVNAIDTPELRARDLCERTAAKVAARLTGEALKGGGVTIDNVKQGSFGGRFVADVFIKGQSLADILTAAQVARPYKPNNKNKWCNL